jgi:serine/threonine-protein kinase
MAVGSQIGAYRLIRRIGEGGMGTVWLAEHTMLGRRAAVKVLHASFSNQQETVARFFNEARAATAIDDPGIVQIFDFGHHVDGSAYIVMELLDGEPLDQRAARGPMALGDVVRIMRQVASALGAAHARGIIHRDLKPENIFVVRDPEVPGGERAKLLDFGIAKLAAGTSNVKTSTQAVMGTPTYMSPEQCRGAGQVDQRSDVYSIGCVLFRLLVGRPPFDAEGVGEILVMHMRDPAPAPSAFVPSIPRSVDQLIARCLAKDPAQRYANGSELASAIGALVTQSGAAGPVAEMPTALSGMAVTPTQAPSRSKGLVVGLAGVVVVGGVAAVVVLGGSNKPDPPVAAPMSQVSVPAAAPVTPLSPAPPKPDPAPDQTKQAIAELVGGFPAWALAHPSSACPSAAQVAGHDVADAWGHPVALTCTEQPDDQIVGAISVGPDGAKGTADDIVSWKLDLAETRGPRWTPKPAVAAKKPPVTKTVGKPAQAAGDDIPDER